eukprot:scaffold15633_cov107-Isochrysis_galbana.AAC.11
MPFPHPTPAGSAARSHLLQPARHARLWLAGQAARPPGHRHPQRARVRTAVTGLEPPGGARIAATAASPPCASARLYYDRMGYRGLFTLHWTSHGRVQPNT